MKLTNYYIPGLLIALAMFSCKKEELPELPEANAPYYSIRGLVNGDSINWVVGIDQTSLSFGTGSMNGIETYYGQINAGTGDMAIRVEILRPEIVYDGTTIAAVKTGETDYLVHKTGSIKFNFGMNYSQFNYVLVKNEFNDFEFMSEVPFDEYGVNNLVIKFTDYSSSESFNLPVRYGFEYNTVNPQFHSNGLGDTLVVTPETLDGMHSWYLNGQLVSQEPVFEKELADGIYELRHMINDLNSNEAEHTTLIRMKDGEFYWQMKYYYLSPEEPSSHFGNVIVSMYKDGTWYSSENAEQNLLSSFGIANIQTIIDAQFSPSSTRFDFDFGSTLFNENQSDSLYLPQMTGTLSVGLK
ncbi:MAG: hypothetical protein HYZ14_04525 [Bacteroidetes bacterium]|nr:hypothetical protein [Bacteroidota bacterium]